MSFLRLLDDPEERDYRGEYEIASEVRITGGTSGDILLRPITYESNRDGLYKYVLSLAAPATYKREIFQTSENGYYFEGGEANEIFSLISLHLRCRIFPVSYMFRDMTGEPTSKYDYPLAYIQPGKYADKPLFDDSTRSFVGLEDLFNRIRNLPEALHHNFANAVRLYALALKEIGTDEQQAYLHLVSAVEILSNDYPLPTEEDPLKDSMDKITTLLEGESHQAKSELGNLFKHRKSMKRFISFVEHYSSAIITERPQVGAIEHKIYKEDLPDALNRIYKARSAVLHAGARMYTSMNMRIEGDDDQDYDFSLGQSIGNREFNPADKLPKIVFFENLVRTCLLKYLEEKTPAA